MALLKYEELKAAIETEELDDRLVVMPLLDRERQIGPASVDVRLGTQFRLLRGIEGPGIDPAHELDPLLTRSEERVSLPFGAHPGQFVLGATLEYLRFPPHLGGYVVGRSSWGRVGLLVATAIMVRPGFAGCLTLELVNHGESPIALYAGCRIAQLAVHSLNGVTEHGYAGKYVGPTGPEISRLDKERVEIAELRKVAERLAATAPSSPAQAPAARLDTVAFLLACELGRCDATVLDHAAPFGGAVLPRPDMHRPGDRAHRGEHDRHYHHQPQTGKEQDLVVDHRQRRVDRNPSRRQSHPGDHPANDVDVGDRRHQDKEELQHLQPVGAAARITDRGGSSLGWLHRHGAKRGVEIPTRSVNGLSNTPHEFNRR